LPADVFFHDTQDRRDNVTEAWFYELMGNYLPAYDAYVTNHIDTFQQPIATESYMSFADFKDIEADLLPAPVYDPLNTTTDWAQEFVDWDAQMGARYDLYLTGIRGEMGLDPFTQNNVPTGGVDYSDPGGGFAEGGLVGRSVGYQEGGSVAQYEAWIREEAARLGIPPDLLLAQASQESAFNPGAVSGAGAQGIFQLMPATAEELGVEDVFDPRQNIRGGSEYMAQLLGQYGGNEELALAAYNAGMGRVAEYGGVPPFPETQQYIERVMSGRERWQPPPDATERRGVGVAGISPELQAILSTQIAGGGFAEGGFVYGMGGGVDDTVPAVTDGIEPAALSSGEFVIPADVVSHLGDGNNQNGANKLYGMLDRIRLFKTGRQDQPPRLQDDMVFPV